MSIDIAVIVSTFERPDHLRRCLLSLERQRGVAGRFEVVVTDDGSSDRTLPLVTEIARRVPFPLTFTTHAHRGFRLARCRNEGIAASTADYLLFTDGDCILPPDHLQTHLAARRHGCVIAGDCIRLGRHASLAVDDEAIIDWRVDHLVDARERRRVRWKAVRAVSYGLGRVPMRPRLSGNNIAAWRHDLETVNGFDEQFVGWGLEDRDLQRRLAAVGVRARTILHRTAPLHLWHEPTASFSRNGIGTPNLRYYSRRAVPPACVDGLAKPGDDRPAFTLPMIGPARPSAKPGRRLAA